MDDLPLTAALAWKIVQLPNPFAPLPAEMLVKLRAELRPHKIYVQHVAGFNNNIGRPDPRFQHWRAYRGSVRKSGQRTIRRSDIHRCCLAILKELGLKAPATKEPRHGWIDKAVLGNPFPEGEADPGGVRAEGGRQD